MPRDAESVVDVLLAAELIEQYLRGVDFERFEANSEKQSAVLHQLMIIGEATKRLSPGFRDQHSHIPWQRMAGMRDRLIHGYDEVDLQLVWEAAAFVLPTIVDQLRRIAPKPEE